MRMSGNLDIYSAVSSTSQIQIGFASVIILSYFGLQSVFLFVEDEDENRILTLGFMHKETIMSDFERGRS